MAQRVRKSDPHHCPECGADFEVSYYDDRVGPRAHEPLISTQARCPACGYGRSVALPAGAEHTLQVELCEGADADEGGGG